MGFNSGFKVLKFSVIFRKMLSFFYVKVSHHLAQSQHWNITHYQVFTATVLTTGYVVLRRHSNHTAFNMYFFTFLLRNGNKLEYVSCGYDVMQPDTLSLTFDVETVATWLWIRLTGYMMWHPVRYNVSYKTEFWGIRYTDFKYLI